MLDRPCLSIAYPYGDHDARVVGAAKRAGYATGATIPERLLATAPQAWPRVGIYHPDSLRAFRFKVSPLTRSFRRSPFWAPLATAARRSGLRGD
jgi:hypothetical protein